MKKIDITKMPLPRTEPVPITDAGPHTTERIKCLLCCAFEGGSNYWIDTVEIPSKQEREKAGAEFWHESPLYGLELGVICETGRHFLNRATLELGLAILKLDQPRHYADFMAENDDADTGDVFLQCCLFAEVIFG